MSRFFAFLAAIMVSFVAISSATASEIGTIRFRLDAMHARPGMVQSDFSSAGNRGHDNHWSTNFTATALTGLDLNRLRAGGDKPLRFALVREAGRLDCGGTGGNSKASGTCAFTADARFTSFLASRGMRRPTRNESFSMMAVDVRRETVEALHTARYPVPTPDELISLTAVGVDAGYISGLARAGYRSPNLDSLLQFKALDINADYIASFERIGYRNLSADQLVELKALGVTAEYASAVQRGSTERLTPGRLVELKAIGFRPR